MSAQITNNATINDDVIIEITTLTEIYEFIIRLQECSAASGLPQKLDLDIADISYDIARTINSLALNLRSIHPFEQGDKTQSRALKCELLGSIETIVIGILGEPSVALDADMTDELDSRLKASSLIKDAIQCLQRTKDCRLLLGKK